MGYCDDGRVGLSAGVEVGVGEGTLGGDYGDVVVIVVGDGLLHSLQLGVEVEVCIRREVLGVE